MMLISTKNSICCFYRWILIFCLLLCVARVEPKTQTENEGLETQMGNEERKTTPENKEPRTIIANGELETRRQDEHVQHSFETTEDHQYNIFCRLDLDIIMKDKAANKDPIYLFEPHSKFNGRLCTHVVASPFTVSYENLDLINSTVWDLLPKLRTLKQSGNHTLKILLQVTLQTDFNSRNKDEQLYPFKNYEKRTLFIRNMVNAMSSYGIDGLYLDSSFHKGHMYDFLILVKELFLKKFILVTEMTLRSDVHTKENWFKISKLVDFIVVKGFERISIPDGMQKFRIMPLYPQNNSVESVEMHIHQLIFEERISPKSLLLAIPFYVWFSDSVNKTFDGNFSEGNTWRFKTACSHLVNARMNRRTATINGGERVYAISSLNSIPFSTDTLDTIAIKANFIVSNDLGGTVAWDADMDDFSGLCSKGFRYPFLSKINQVFGTQKSFRSLQPQCRSMISSKTSMKWNPTVVVNGYIFNAVRGSNLTVKCIAEGDVPSKIEWIHVEKQRDKAVEDILTESFHHTESRRNSHPCLSNQPYYKIESTLVIENVAENDTGKYFCRTNNISDPFFVQLSDRKFAVQDDNIWIERKQLTFNIPPGAENSAVKNHDKKVLCQWNMKSRRHLQNSSYFLDLGDNSTHLALSKLCSYFVHSTVVLNENYQMTGNDIGELKRISSLRSNDNAKHLLRIEIDKAISDKATFVSHLFKQQQIRTKFIIYMIASLSTVAMDGLVLSSSFYKNAGSSFNIIVTNLKNRFKKKRLLLAVEIELRSKNDLKDYYGTISQVGKKCDLVIAIAHGYSTADKIGYNAPVHSVADGDESIEDNLKYLKADHSASMSSIILQISSTAFRYNIPKYSSFPFLNSHSGQPQQLHYNHVCSNLQSFTYFDLKAKVPFAADEKHWTTFENPASIAEKVKLVNQLGLKGVMLDAIEMDDVKGECTKHSYPLLKTINFELGDQSVRLDCNNSNKKRQLFPIVTIYDDIKEEYGIGENVTVQCKVEGDAETNIFWIKHTGKDSQILSNNAQFSIKEKKIPTQCVGYAERKSQLTLSVTADSVGKYSCMANNSEGADAGVFFLNLDDREFVIHDENIWIEEIPTEFNASRTSTNSTVKVHDKIIICEINMPNKKADLDNGTDEVPFFNQSDVKNLLQSDQCTYIVYGLNIVSDGDYTIQADELHFWLNLTIAYNVKLLLKIGLPNNNAKDKTNNRVQYINNLVKSRGNRKTFVSNMKAFVKIHKLKGIILNYSWLYHATKLDQEFLTLAKELKSEFRSENLITVIETELNSQFIIKNNYNAFSDVSEVFDLIVLKGFNFENRKKNLTTHNAPIHSKETSDEDIYENFKYLRCTNELITNKLILAVPFFGYEYSLLPSNDSEDSNSNSEGYNYGLNQLFKQSSKKILRFNQICERVGNRTSWKTYWDHIAEVPFMKSNSTWISFENIRSIREKCMLVKKLDFKGVMIVSVEMDDMKQHCSNVTFPLLRTINDALRKPIPPDNSLTSPAVTGWITATVLLFCLMIAAVGYSLYARRKIVGLTQAEIKHFKDGYATKESSGEVNPENRPYDASYEILPCSFTLDTEDVLGSGAFGIVFKGKVGSETVAIKSTKPGADVQYLKSLLTELKILIYLDKHPNIVNLIGASTTNLKSGKVYIFVELCPFGNLHDYLRKSRKKFQTVSSFEFDKSTDAVLYENKITEENEEINIGNLLSWSYQIAKGLQHLCSKKLIHGDLATRNVLLYEKNIAKLTDFGLSRKLYNYSNYTKRNEEPLPWRWMAIESLRDLTFSFQSDIWAFGVTIWEIFSLAETPYPGCTWTTDFVEQLDNNFRMAKPKYATNDIYAYMLECWRKEPEKRPTPEQTVNHFRVIAENEAYLFT